MATQDVTKGFSSLTFALQEYLHEIASYHDICARNEKISAVHNSEQALEVYRMYQRDGRIAQQLHTSVKCLPDWEESTYWKQDGAQWRKLKAEIDNRVEKHSNQCHFVSKGIVWEHLPVLVHAYKFDADRRMKVELIMPEVSSPLPLLPARKITTLLTCHEFLVPELAGKPLPPYAGHEAKFTSISEYLWQSTPRELYVARCFPQPHEEKRNNSSD